MYNQQQNKPIDKGRVVCIAEKYKAGNETKNRYATLGRATKWPSNQQGGIESIELEIDTMPINQQGPLKLYIFWDSEQSQSQNGYATQQHAPQQHAPQQYPQQHAPQQYPQQHGQAYGSQRQ